MYRIFPGNEKVHNDDIASIGKMRKDEEEEKQLSAALGSIAAKIKK